VLDVEEGVGEPDSALMRATTVGLAGNSNAWPMAMSLVAMTMAMASMCGFGGAGTGNPVGHHGSVENPRMWRHVHGGD
jgi:hypothetical protein